MKEHITKEDIPEELTEFQPIPMACTGVQWTVNIDHATGKVTIDREKPSYTGPMALSIFMSLFTFCVVGVVFHQYQRQIFSPNGPGYIILAFCVAGLIMGVLFLFICPLMYGLANAIEDSSWPDPRFEYDMEEKSLFFPRENKRYLKNDYLNVVLGSNFRMTVSGLFTGVSKNDIKTICRVESTDGAKAVATIFSQPLKGLRNMTDFMSAPISEVVKAILEDGTIDAAEVEQLRKRLYADDSIIDKEEAEALFQINDGVKGKANAPEWTKLFSQAVCDYLLKDESSPGEVDEAEAAWLIGQLEGDGEIDANEKMLLLTLKENAKKLPDSLRAKLKSWGV